RISGRAHLAEAGRTAQECTSARGQHQGATRTSRKRQRASSKSRPIGKEPPLHAKRGMTWRTHAMRLACGANIFRAVEGNGTRHQVQRLDGCQNQCNVCRSFWM